MLSRVYVYINKEMYTHICMSIFLYVTVMYLFMRLCYVGHVSVDWVIAGELRDLEVFAWFSVQQVQAGLCCVIVFAAGVALLLCFSCYGCLQKRNQ